MSDAAPAPTRLWFAGKSSAGLVRSVNEDRFCVSEIGGPTERGEDDCVERLTSPRGFVLAVYDGAGGAEVGEVASAIAAKTIASALTVTPEPDADPRARLEAAFGRANAAILADAKAEPKRRGMGCTATVVEQRGDRLWIGQVGDTRAYLLRSRSLVQLTRDDTLANEALLLGDLRPEEVADFPHKSIVLSALGMAATTRSAVTSVALRLDDALLLCTDGLHALVDRRTIRAILLRHREPGVAARVLVDEAMRAGGNDNIALVVARFEASYLVPPQASDTLKDEALPG